ncbi:hypothetical protein EDC04DRAFT_778045 [Pisolithus marmoratus]|nr:hypothetical protein EDC04DRAFT_778045 [Pisolithus marmoratus]
MTTDDAVLSIMVLGEIGVGKSSVVNLIAGENIAEVSPNANVCTRRTIKYDATVESMRMHIWEVSGFNQPGDGLKWNATDFMERLGPLLKAKASVDTIPFCMRGLKLTTVTMRIFELIDDIFGGRIPIVLVINHLEREREMEDWWERNGHKLGGSMSRTKHVCVTGLQQVEKSRKSRANLVALLRSEYISRERTNVPLESALEDYLERSRQLGSSRGWSLDQANWALGEWWKRM